MLVRPAIASRPAPALPAPAIGTHASLHRRPKAVAAPVDIDSLLLRRHWEDGWQEKLLEAADADAGRDGRTTGQEIDEYLSSPDDLRFLSSGAILREEALVGRDRRAVDELPAGWERSLARAADSDDDGVLQRHELDDYVLAIQRGHVASSEWIPDQKVAPLKSVLAEDTHELDFLVPQGPRPEGAARTRNHMRFEADLEHRVPRWTSYELTTADLVLTPSWVKRDGIRWKEDSDLGDASARDSDYLNNPYGLERGHLKMADDAPTLEAMKESFLFSNGSPQFKKFNGELWKLLEMGTHQLIHAQAPGARATIVTGCLFLDEDGRPGEQRDLKWLNGRVGVPTHVFKAVLVQLADGTTKTFAYLCPNTMHVGKKPAERYEFLAKHRISVDQLERLAGVDFFSALDDRLEGKLEANATPTFVVPDPTHHREATNLWPQDEASLVDAGATSPRTSR